MLRALRFKYVRGTRLNSNFTNKTLLDLDIDVASRPKLNEIDAPLRTFGKIVDADDSNGREVVIDRDEFLSNSMPSPFRRESGAPIHGKNAHEARLLPETLKARTYRDQIELNPLVAQAIKNNILSLHIPNNVRRSAANYFVEIHRQKLHRPAKTDIDVDSHIASIFVQNYGAIYQSLAELRKRVGLKSFKPKRILDVGYGPATGIVALNDLMGVDFRPELKEAVILSSVEMQKRAKIILSRQLSEIPEEIGSEPFTQSEKQGDNDQADEISENEDLIGEVMTKKIRIVTKLSSSIPSSKNYDLIILTHQMLKSEDRFPIQVDDNVEHYLNLLSPGGHIVIIERGNPLGFEIISRARQIMIRPENYPDEHGKIPRPWWRGSSARPRRDFETDESTVDDEISEEAKQLIDEMNAQHGDIEPKDLEFEPELMEEMNRREEKEQELKSTNYHLKIIAPCPHHRKCPLQIGNPNYYEYDEGKKLKFCNFQKSMVRPKFNIELKKGKILATRWQEPTDGVGVDGLAKPGTGRPNGRNYEILNYSYLIAERSPTDPETASRIERERRENAAEYGIGSLGDNTELTWPRIVNQPLKRKGHVTMDLCGSSGQLEKWTIPKSFTKEIYHDARKAMKGDLWGLDAKTKIIGAANLKVEKFEKLEKERIKRLRMKVKKQDREVSEKYNEIENKNEELDEDDIEALAKVYGYDFSKDSKSKEKKYAKRKIDVNEQLS